MIITLPITSAMIAQDAQVDRFIEIRIGPFNKKDIPGTMILK